MKKIFTFLSLAILSFTAYNQGIISTSHIWNNLAYYYPSYIFTENFRVSSTITIDTKEYFTVQRTTNKNFVGWSTYGYAREEDGKVYFRKLTTSQELLVYDFNVEIGDTLTVANIYYSTDSDYYTEVVYHVRDIDSLLVGDSYKKQIHLESIIEGSVFTETEQWVENLGSLSGIFHNYDGLIGSQTYTLLCFQINEEVAYTNPSYSSCYYYFTNDIEDYNSGLTTTVQPNPILEYGMIKLGGAISGNNYDIEIFDSRGALVNRASINDEYMIYSSDYKKGLYLYRIMEEGIPVGAGKFIIR